MSRSIPWKDYQVSLQRLNYQTRIFDYLSDEIGILLNLSAPFVELLDFIKLSATIIKRFVECRLQTKDGL